MKSLATYGISHKAKVGMRRWAQGRRDVVTLKDSLDDPNAFGRYDMTGMGRNGWTTARAPGT